MRILHLALFSAAAMALSADAAGFQDAGSESGQELGQELGQDAGKPVAAREDIGGIVWELDFDVARARAARESKPLLIVVRCPP